MMVESEPELDMDEVYGVDEIFSSWLRLRNPHWTALRKRYPIQMRLSAPSAFI